MEVNIQRVNRLSEYVREVMERKDGTELYNRYKEDIQKVTPQEAFQIFFNQLQRGSTAKEILQILDKVIHVFHKSLSEYEWRMPEKDSFLDTLMKENEALEAKLSAIKEIIKKKDFKNNNLELLRRIEELQQFDAHYLKKENILFPYMEKKMEKYEGLTIMWSLHDEARSSLKRLIYILNSEDASETDFNTEIGSLFFILYGLSYKEKHILFPSAAEVINEEEWAAMKKQSYEYGFPFIETPPMDKEDLQKKEPEVVKENAGFFLKTETGVLSFEQALMIFNSLPMDLSFVDEHNKVRFYTRPKDRLFPRSPAVIGRDVRNCHPPESMNKVNEIVDEFRKGHKDAATFWIQMKGRTILIQYFALRNAEGEYKGVLEASQDITELKKIEGEKRLLEWN